MRFFRSLADKNFPRELIAYGPPLSSSDLQLHINEADLFNVNHRRPGMDG